MKIVGLDACKLSVVACVLDCNVQPPEPRQFYYDAPFRTFPANAIGVTSLLALKPDVAVIEPTGINYIKLWCTHLARNGVKVVLVGHSQLHYYRETVLELPDKDDRADALALAYYYYTYHSSDRRFVQVRDPVIVRIRELVLRLAHLNRCQSPVINRLRQDLAWQFPEVAKIRSQRHGDKDPLLWGWLAKTRNSSKYDEIYSRSIGLGLTDTVRLHAARLCDYQREEAAIERELSQLILDERFIPYRKVFAAFGFGQRVEAMLLSQIYPIENYLDVNGKPIVKISRARFSTKNKASKKHLSRRRFEKALGSAPSERSSGDKKGNKTKKIVGGSDLCRKALWQWLFTRVEPVKTNRRTNSYLQQIGEKLDNEKALKAPIRLARMRTISYAVRLLFYALVRAMN
jgi:transposase